jgi:hypothetical protein
METLNYQEIIRESIDKCANEEGWANLAELGNFLRQNGVKYGKLKKFLSSYSEFLDIRTDENKMPPVVYARMKSNSMAF